MGDSRLFAVVGKPVGFSRSPGIFGAGFADAGMNHGYTRMAADSGAHALGLARSIGLAGLSVTAPFKEEIFDELNRHDATAASLGAVNVVDFSGDEPVGHNTDPVGVAAALDHFAISGGSRVVLLGAGGAALSVCHELDRRDIEQVSIFNRTEGRAKKVADQFGFGVVTEREGPAAVEHSDLILSCLPAHALLPGWFVLRPDHMVIDAVYNGSRVELAAKIVGCRYLGGVTWLVAQARRAFEIWTGVAPSKSAMTHGLGAPVFRCRRGTIALVGLPGSGKSTVGKILAELLDREFIDTDALIEKRMNKSVAQIFSEDGEGAFRKLEARVSSEVLCGDSAVVALGGGAAQNPATASLINSVQSVWLFARLEVCSRRADSGTRPLLDGRDRLSVLKNLLDVRAATYCAVADLVVDTSRLEPRAVAERIVDEMG